METLYFCPKYFSIYTALMFLVLSWISKFSLKLLVLLMHILQEKLKTLGGIHKIRKSKYWIPFGLGPRTSATASAPRFELRSSLCSGHWARHQIGFNIFDYRISWNHPKFPLFKKKIFVKPPWISKKSMKPEQKKRAVSI